MDEEDDEGPEMPQGTRMSQTRKRGWGGGDMEMEHQQDATRKEKRKNFAAVQVEQFQNTVVGEGYQAKHVIRQPSHNKEAAKMVDMTGGKAPHDDSKKSEFTSRFDRSNYIQSKGLRDFRREIEKILAQP